MKKRAAVLFLAVLLIINSGTTAMAADSSNSAGPSENSLFTDLPESHWAYQYVSDLVKRGVVSGCSDGSFQPERGVTYGEAFKLILRAIGVPAPAAQPGKHWAYPYIQSALYNALVYSFDDGDLDETPTRREVARMAARALDFTDISGDSPYDDCHDGYVVKLYEQGVMVGVINEDGSRSFQPDDPISRDEMSTVIWNMMNLDVAKGMFRYGSYWLDVFEDVPANPYEDINLFVTDEKNRLNYTDGYYAHGIDISLYQGNIDWEAVAADGIDFAIVRAGGRYYGRYGSGAVFEDGLFDQNMQGAIDAGVAVGAYFFSNAITVEEAIEEADMILSKLESYREYVTYPVVCDWEAVGGVDGRTYGVDGEVVTDCIDAFCSRVEEAGYIPMVYFNKYWGYTRMDLRDLKQYDFWFAGYTSYPSFRYGFQLWQYSSSGRVDGINGDVDMDLCFVPYGNGYQREPDTSEEFDSPADDVIENG